METVKNWLEFNLNEYMTWIMMVPDWNIDHTLPLNIFDLNNDDDIFICFNWKKYNANVSQRQYCKK